MESLHEIYINEDIGINFNIHRIALSLVKCVKCASGKVRIARKSQIYYDLRGIDETGALSIKYYHKIKCHINKIYIWWIRRMEEVGHQSIYREP